jgi:hypothetical protein
MHYLMQILALGINDEWNMTLPPCRSECGRTISPRGTSTGWREGGEVSDAVIILGDKYIVGILKDAQVLIWGIE